MTLLSLAKRIGLALVVQGGILFLVAPRRLLHCVGVGLTAVIGSSLTLLAVCASFEPAWWSAEVCQPDKVSALWPASWVSAVDECRSSRSAEVRDTWEIYDDRLQFVPVAAALAIGDTLPTGDVHRAWENWSRTPRLSWLEGPCLPA